MSEFTLEQKTEMSHAFNSGSYANAYDSNDLDDFDLDSSSEHDRAAFVLGFFSTYALHEIPSDARELFDECYFSAAGQYVISVARYTDSRDEEYQEEMANAR